MYAQLIHTKQENVKYIKINENYLKKDDFFKNKVVLKKLISILTIYGHLVFINTNSLFSFDRAKIQNYPCKFRKEQSLKLTIKIKPINLLKAQY